MGRVILALVLTIVAGTHVASAQDEFECGYEDSMAATINPIDTTLAVALYGCWDSASTLAPPYFWMDIWDSTFDESNPRYWIENSKYKHLVMADPKARDEDTCFTSVHKPTGLTGGSDFVLDIFAEADSFLDFSVYDYDENDTVDFVFMMIVNTSDAKGFPMLATSYTTDDGVVINRHAGVSCYVNRLSTGVAVPSHEYGHKLGLPDLYYGPRSQCGLGGLSLMSKLWFDRASPLDPQSKIKLGWITPIEVTTPLWNHSVNYYFTTDSVFTLNLDEAEYFIVSNYRNGEDAPFWEQNFRSNGLLLWHFYDSSSNAGTGGMIDAECAHGLWYWEDEVPLYEDPVAGTDSIDHCKSGGSRTTYWREDTKTTFDGLSNPSAAWYRDFENQDIISHVAVRNITGEENSVFHADLLVNNWYGTLPGNTTWGPNKTYAITGDVTVVSGDTLFLLPGTTLKFQADEDNQAGGQDTTRCELIIHGHIEADGHPDSVITFTSSAPNPDKRDWYGIYLKSQSSGNFSNCTIEYAEYGIRSNQAHLDVDSCEISDSYQHGIYASGADLSVYRTKYRRQQS